MQVDPVDVLIIIESSGVLNNCGNRAKACTLLMGLIYLLNLVYPANLKYTYDAFQKIFLDLDGLKMHRKDQTLKNKLLA